MSAALQLLLCLECLPHLRNTGAVAIPMNRSAYSGGQRSGLPIGITEYPASAVVPFLLRSLTANRSKCRHSYGGRERQQRFVGRDRMNCYFASTTSQRRDERRCERCASINAVWIPMINLRKRYARGVGVIVPGLLNCFLTCVAGALANLAFDHWGHSSWDSLTRRILIGYLGAVGVVILILPWLHQITMGRRRRDRQDISSASRQ